jgi:carnitine O-acetyltransferase
MDTWRWMFDCCRVPGQKGLDWSVTHAKTSDTGETGHIIVIRRGRFYKIDMFIEGRLLSTAELEK